MAPCCRCSKVFEQPGTSTWWGKGKYKYMNGKTTNNEPARPPGQPVFQPDYPDSDEEEKLDKKLDTKPVPVMPLGPAPSSSCGGSASSSSSAMPIVMDLTADD